MDTPPPRPPPRRQRSHPGVKVKSKGGGGAKSGANFASALLGKIQDFMPSTSEGPLNLMPSCRDVGKDAKCVPALDGGFLVQVGVVKHDGFRYSWP